MDMEPWGYTGVYAALTHRIIGCAIEVHRHLGPGLLESNYQAAMAVELELQGLPFQQQMGLPLYYKGRQISEYRPDLIVDEAVVVEIKSIKNLEDVHMAQVLTYLKVTRLRVGLLLNFNTVVMKDGIRRIVL
jgi:GxxExxY protein